jgi:hypothetical protein
MLSTKRVEISTNIPYTNVLRIGEMMYTFVFRGSQTLYNDSTLYTITVLGSQFLSALVEAEADSF